MPKRGRKAEIKVATYLKRKGAKVKISPGSRGSADIIAKWPSGKRWLIQVKSSGRKVKDLSSKEKHNLVRRAQRNKAVAVKAEVEKGKITFKSVRNGRILKP